MTEKNKEKRCNFCGISQSTADLLISGPDAYICDECVDTAHKLIEERRMNPKGREAGGFSEKEVKIIREITLPQEFQQTGFMLLCYIPKVIKYKIPGITFSTNISFKNGTVYLYITGPERKKEEIEKVLADFALVVQGINKTETFFDGPEQIAELKHRLHMTSVDLEQFDVVRSKQGVIEKKQDEPLESKVEKLHERISWILRKEIEDIDGLFD